MRMIITDAGSRLDFIRRISEITLDGKRKYIGDFKIYRCRRSLPQNSLLHLWLTCISKETGNDVETLKIYFKRKYLPIIEGEVFGKKEQHLTHTSDLNTKEFSTFMDNIYQEMLDEQSIYLPQPGDQAWPEFYSQYGIK
jgi:hypothetical protein